MKSVFAALLLLMACPYGARAESIYARGPSLHGDTLVFTAEGDLWRVPLAGGTAQRLTSNAGEESQASISPDGRRIAFVGSYDASPEVYVMPIDGGAPKRLSFDGAGVRVVGWTPANEVLFASTAVTGPGSSMILRAVNPDTLIQRSLPFADANQASFDAKSGSIFFTRFGLHITGDHARGYKGGAMAQLWRAPADGSAEATRLDADVNASLRRPMWWKGRLYHLSDETGSDNLWSMGADGSDRRALTSFNAFEVRDPQLQDGHIVYQYGADIRDIDLATGTDRVVPIDLVSDFEQRRTRWLEKPLDYLDDVALNADGSRAVLVARGSATYAATDARRRIDIAVPKDARIRAAVPSSDGKSIYAISDIGGHEEIWRFPADGSGPGEALTRDSNIRRWHLYLSPDGKSLAFDDKRARLSVLDLGTRKIRVVDESHFGGDDVYASVNWSADSKTLAVARPDSREGRPQIVLVALDGSQKAVVSSDRYESGWGVFSRDGKWLYFLSNREFATIPQAPWGDRNMGPTFDRRTKIYALALQPGNRFAFQPADELNKDDKDSGKDKDEDKKDDKKKSDAKTPPLPAIAWNGLSQRLYEVPADAGNYRSLTIDDKRLYFLDEGVADAHPQLKTLVLGNDGDEAKTFAEDIGRYQLSADAKKLLLVKWSEHGAGAMFIVDAGDKAPDKMDKSKLRVSDWRLAIDPRAEWKQMFNDAWRMHREFSFDPGMRGVDWDAVYARYEPLLARVADRNELEDLTGQMTAELGILHSQVRGGDKRRDDEVAKPAALGADLVAVGDGLKIAHIYRSDPELPNERAPLARPGVDAREGDVLTAINGRPVRTLADVADALANQAGKQVLLALSRAGDARKTVATAIDSRGESDLRYGDWEQSRRDRVLDSGKGRIGYLHLRAMGSGDIADFAREFYTNIHRDGLIIDVRRNNGGNIDSWIIEKLLRRSWAFWVYPDSPPEFNMQQTFRGHLAVLIDERTYSDGETFAAGIKALNLAPLIGQRTSGAGIWLSGRNPLIDGGMARVAEFPQFSAENGRWLIEGRGVSPDMAVVNPPQATFNGGDAQLDAALKYLEDKMAAEPIKSVTPQAIPPRGEPAWDLHP
ncbi:MAG: PDZ domain-containing protein [Xanthomonadales bacterium]|nr:PDZ domain-containing protein [Xanthomonadales bacterium]